MILFLTKCWKQVKRKTETSYLVMLIAKLSCYSDSEIFLHRHFSHNDNRLCKNWNLIKRFCFISSENVYQIYKPHLPVKFQICLVFRYSKTKMMPEIFVDFEKILPVGCEIFTSLVSYINPLNPKTASDSKKITHLFLNDWHLHTVCSIKKLKN